jgi:hypothetical protein
MYVMTLSPGLKRFTPGPKLTTSPATSVPVEENRTTIIITMALMY